MKAPAYSPQATTAIARARAAPRYIANFDSMAAMVRGLGRYLRGKDKDFPRVGMLPPFLDPLAPMVNSLPLKVKEVIYTWSGWSEAIPAHRLGQVRAEGISRWVVSEYPRRRYQAIMVGSSNGAATHLCAALGIPWLPQTALIPVRHSEIHPDAPKAALEWGKAPARLLLDNNPELQLHHMHDANQDRLMIQRMAYFRVKRLRLGDAFERFIHETLAPGGTIYLSECQLSWPTTRVDRRHVFQSGALGGATVDEFMHSSERVAEYLERYGSDRRRWDSPEPDSISPESEWGFEPSLRDDVERIARQRGYRVQRIVFEQPEDLSPLVADFYRWWYRQRSFDPSRLLIESFIVLEPWWTLRTGSTPYWMVFNMEKSAEAVEHYLDNTEPFDDINLMLFSHGVECVGLPPTERWRDILARAQKRGGYIGVEEEKFPADFAVFVRYNKDLQSRVSARYPMPGPMALTQLEDFLEQHGSRYNVQWLDHPVKL